MMELGVDKHGIIVIAMVDTHAISVGMATGLKRPDSDIEEGLDW